MKSPLQLPLMKLPLILALWALGALSLTSCASSVRTVLSPLPVDESLRRPCPETVQPADPVTPSVAFQFGHAAMVEARCWKAIAVSALAVIDRHNEAAGE